jgi:hypothetical protein
MADEDNSKDVLHKISLVFGAILYVSGAAQPELDAMSECVYKKLEQYTPQQISELLAELQTMLED